MSYAFHNIALFEHFTDLNLSKYVFYVIQTWEMHALQFYWMVLIFLLLDGAYLFQNSHFAEIIPQFLTWLPTLQVGFQNCGKVYAELEKAG